MEIPYEVSARPDTGLYNAKLGIWLFLASEVMLFGGLFSAYVYERVVADPCYWPHGLLNVPVGTFNTLVLIGSSVTVVLAWASLKMRRWNRYLVYMGITIFCGLAFLGIKLGIEWPAKFKHFGVFLKQDALSKYEPYLGNEEQAKLKKEIRREISGDLEKAVVTIGGKEQTYEVESAGDLTEKIAEEIADLRKDRLTIRLEEEATKHNQDLSAEDRAKVKAEVASWLPAVKVEEFEIKLDQVNADPTNPANERPVFVPRELSDKVATIDGGDIESWSAFTPRHSSYFSTYFLITGLHGLHVLAGVIVFVYFFFFGKKLYLRNPEHMANRVEVAGLFWHFVDLVWIFVFPIFYLL